VSISLDGVLMSLDSVLISVNGVSMSSLELWQCRWIAC
jgi:hypothetical protein